MRLMRPLVLSFWALAIALMLAGTGRAHKLLVSTMVEGKNDLKIMAFFPDGSPAREIPVTVAPADGSDPLNGKTDAQGLCRFIGLKPGTYQVAAGDPLGHRGEAKIVIPGAVLTADSRALEKPAAVVAGSPALPATPSGEPLPWGNILGGLGFIFGLTALVMVLKLKSDLRRYASRD